MRLKFISLLCLILLGIGLVIPIATAQAEGSVSKQDMINMMNSWRASYWPNPLVEDPSLSYCAQWTADEMNRIGANEHLLYLGYLGASARCQGHGFVTENWCTHSSMTIDELSNCWDDPDHMLPATSQQYTTVGVGISGNYYILQAGTIMGDGSSVSSGSSVLGNNTTSATQAPVVNTVIAFSTSTPDLDGTIKHVVRANDTLYTIAVNYNVSIEQIKTLSKLTSNDIYPGNVLIISLLPTPTITPTRTSTVPMPTRTVTPTPMPTTPRPTRTVTPTPDPSSASGLPKIDRQWLGLGLLVLSAVGFFVVFYFLFLRPATKHTPPAVSAEPSNNSEEKTPVVAAKPLQKPVKKTTAPATGNQPKKASKNTKPEILTDEPKKATRKTKSEPENVETKKTVKKKKTGTTDGGTSQE